MGLAWPLLPFWKESLHLCGLPEAQGSRFVARRGRQLCVKLSAPLRASTAPYYPECEPSLG